MRHPVTASLNDSRVIREVHGDAFGRKSSNYRSRGLDASAFGLVGVSAPHEPNRDRRR